MEAPHNLTQSSNSGKSPISKSGVLTIHGFGVRVRMQSGHLEIEDGIGPERRKIRLARVGHGLKRLVCISEDGFATLGALKWLADVGASFVMLDRNGSVLVTTGPVRPSDAKLRRAQALAHQSGLAVRIARELIGRKLAGQEQLVHKTLRDPSSAAVIARALSEVKTADSIQSIRQWEAYAAHAYWSAWAVPVMFPQRDLSRVPDHWRTFCTRQSPLTGSPRLAVNPPNAMLNYLYALLESESRLALAALGLDPGIGMLHVDAPARDSLASDLMEAVRPQVDAYVLDWIRREPLRREWFFEQYDGNCRLMGSFAIRLSETATIWGRAVTPIAEWIARTLWSGIRRPARQIYPATRLTQSRRRQAKGNPSDVPIGSVQRPPHVCRACGELLKRGVNHCAECSKPFNKAGLIEAARLGRIATHSQKAEAQRAATQRRHAAALKAWDPSSKPAWLSEETYRKEIQPRLASVTVPTISLALGISEPYATDIRAGRRRPHPRHWQTLARLVGVAPDE